MATYEHEFYASEDNQRRLSTLTHIMYALQALGLMFFLPWLAAILINYSKRSDVNHTWLATHFDWQMRTFWGGLIFYLIGLSSVWFLGFGLVVLMLTYLWIIYRIVRGWLKLCDGKVILPTL